MNIYVGNLPRTATEEQLAEKFKEVAGVNVTGVKIIKDKFTGESRKFGFLDIADPAEAQRAIDAMNGYDLEGNRLVVNEAKGGPGERSGGGRPGGNRGFGGPRSNNGGGFGGGGFRKNSRY
jgi:RNA recognition motif-containing protein